jgi:hypothetical protein
LSISVADFPVTHVRIVISGYRKEEITKLRKSGQSELLRKSVLKSPICTLYLGSLFKFSIKFSISLIKISFYDILYTKPMVIFR